MTYDDTVLNQDASDSLDQVQDDLGDLNEQVFDDVQEFFFEENFTFNEEPQFEMEMPMEMEMNTFQFAEEFIEEFFMEFEPQFMMEPEGMKLEEGPIVMFTDDVMMEEIYEETEELVATFLPMVSEKEEFSSEESFVQSDGPVFMEPTENTETFEQEEMMEEKPPVMTETFQEEEMIEEKPTMIQKHLMKKK